MLFVHIAIVERLSSNMLTPVEIPCFVKSDAPAKWDMIATGKWIQKAAWNRWVTKSERDQPHKTPITSSWTANFLTREGEGRKAVGDWLRDKTVSWKARRRLLQTNTGVFPCEARLQKWGKHPDGICELCKRCRELGLKLLGGRPARGTTGHLQSSVCRLQAPAATGAHNECFQRVQDDMGKVRSVCKDWEFVSTLERDRDLAGEICVGILHATHTRLVNGGGLDRGHG
jgi:hypothetical protein